MQLIVDGRFFLGKNKIAEFDSVTLEWELGAPEHIRAIGAVYKGVNIENDALIEILSAYNQDMFTALAIDHEMDLKIAMIDKLDVRMTYYSDIAHGLK